MRLKHILIYIAIFLASFQAKAELPEALSQQIANEAAWYTDSTISVVAYVDSLFALWKENGDEVVEEAIYHLVNSGEVHPENRRLKYIIITDELQDRMTQSNYRMFEELTVCTVPLCLFSILVVGHFADLELALKTLPFTALAGLNFGLLRRSLDPTKKKHGELLSRLHSLMKSECDNLFSAE